MAATDFLTSMVSLTVMRPFLSDTDILSLIRINSQMVKHFETYPHLLNHQVMHVNVCYQQTLSERLVKVQRMQYNLQYGTPFIKRLPSFCTILDLYISSFLSDQRRYRDMFNSLSWIFHQLMQDDCSITSLHLHLTIEQGFDIRTMLNKYHPKGRLPCLKKLSVVGHGRGSEKFLQSIFPYIGSSPTLKQFSWFNYQGIGSFFSNQTPPSVLTHLEIDMEYSSSKCQLWFEVLQHHLVTLKLENIKQAISFPCMKALRTLILISESDFDITSILISASVSFPRLRTLDLSNCCLQDDKIISIFENNDFHELKTVRLNNNDLSDTFVTYLCHAKNTSTLNVSLHHSWKISNLSLQVYRNYLISHPQRDLFIDFSKNPQINNVLLFEIVNLLAKQKLSEKMIFELLIKEMKGKTVNKLFKLIQ